MGVKFTQNDLRSRHRQFAQAAGNAVVTGGVVIFGMHLTGVVDASTLTIYDALTATGTGIQLNAALGGSAEFRFEHTGIRFTTGLTIASTGTTPSIVVRYMAETGSVIA
jgi:hypothetical protein